MKILSTSLHSLLLLGGLLFPTTASATVTAPFPGVQLVRDGGKAMIIGNLCAPGVSVRTTKYGERRATPETWGAARGLQAAINADFFNFPAATYVLGRARGGGEDWPASAQLHEPHAYFEFGPGLADWVNPATTGPSPGATEIIGTHDPIIVGGVQYDDGDIGDTHPRSAVGLNFARTRIYLFASHDAISGPQITAAMLAMSAEANGGVSDIDVANAVDGGGSTQMYVQGQGQIITSGRLVANHIGIFATGSGGSPQCPVDPYPRVERRVSADIDGDGTGDICGRSATGVVCELMKDGEVGAEITGPAWADANTWAQSQYTSTVQFADVNGDGKSDVCGRAGSGIICQLSDGTAFPTQMTSPACSDASGWALPQYYSTIQFPDIDGDGKADLCARAGAGVLCWLSDGMSFPTAVTGPLWSDASGWNAAKYYSSIQFPDLDGDGKSDVCGRNEDGVTCYLSDGMSFPTPVVGPAWSDASGWDVAATGSTIHFVDLNGDKKADICGRGADGIHCALSTGTGFGPDIVGPAWSDADGWANPDQYRTIQFLDINGDGNADICGRTTTGIVCQTFDGTKFGPDIAGPAWGDSDSWNQAEYYITIGAADVNHDGKDDLCGRNATGMLCAPANGNGFDTPTAGPAWTDESGWSRPVLYSSIRYVGIPIPVPPTPTTTNPGSTAGDGGSAPDGALMGNGSDSGVKEPGCATTASSPRTAGGVSIVLFSIGTVLAMRRRRTRMLARRSNGYVGSA